MTCVIKYMKEGVGKIRGRLCRPLIFPTPSILPHRNVIPTAGRNLLYGKTHEPVNSYDSTLIIYERKLLTNGMSVDRLGA